MSTRDYDSEIQQAETDLAFALAQGDGYAEDAAAERIETLRRERDTATESESESE